MFKRGGMQDLRGDGFMTYKVRRGAATALISMLTGGQPIGQVQNLFDEIFSPTSV